MDEPRVWVFFYGTFINPEVVEKAGAALHEVEVARLPGFDIDIGPLANLVRSDQSTVYGVIAQMTHADLQKLYTMAWVGTYLPEAVLVQTRDGRLVPAMTYIKPSMHREQPAEEYIDRIVEPGRRYGFPQWFLDRLESFRAGRRQG